MQADTGDDRLWQQVLEDLGAEPLMKAEHIILSDPAVVTGISVGAELVLQVTPGFEAGLVTRPDVINRIRQSAARIAGRPIQVRTEDKPAKQEIKNDKLDQLGQFSNVTIR